MYLNLISKQKNDDGSYPPIQTFHTKVDGNAFPDALIFPEEFMPVFYPSDKRAAGFVTIEDDGTTVTSCVWDEEAYQKWCEENPEHPEAPATPTTEDRLSALEGAVLSMMGVNLNV